MAEFCTLSAGSCSRAPRVVATVTLRLSSIPIYAIAARKRHIGERRLWGQRATFSNKERRSPDKGAQNLSRRSATRCTQHPMVQVQGGSRAAALPPILLNRGVNTAGLLSNLAERSCTCSHKASRNHRKPRTVRTCRGELDRFAGSRCSRTTAHGTPNRHQPRSPKLQ
jgi:hypothetical protein